MVDSSKLDFSKLTGFEWDRGNLDHIKKHNVGFEECEKVFVNIPLFVNKDDRHSQVEKRFRVYGRTDINRSLCLVVVVRKNRIRVISARDQNKKERAEFRKRGGENK